MFISPPGVNAETATADQLLLHITSATAQIIMQGVAASPFPRIIPHGFGYAPIIIPNLISTDIVGGFGYVRPFDNSWGPYTNSNIKSETTQFTVNQTGTVLSVNYFVFDKMAP